ncbi:hypothetical protein CE91St62_26210 [Lachnospiraceae bacterium]|uniref:oligosaccharide flippase family protein n=1 Tax=Extibacter sp. GGCC_0201 TaxID=2731209 RepID=UPI001AA10FF4|nr:oligosaccharide flippase family protein [Extibacter sp. GGCC_0201]MBO1722605.1 oligosaccharide flippase family protein [Extibacter sp. GGCC_0201]BDF34558.1 hypothetical protein CE91St61_26330 [Lachnospiraceae bacterium]BDF38560.1 hypothetical protein CE91St62_26210 [Lachnospiraceae bacterium]
MIKLYIEKIKNSDILKNIAVLASGVVIGYAINMLLLPVISRIFTPSELGEYDLILSNGNIISSFVTMALLVAIMIPKEDDEAVKICKLIRTANCLFLLVIFVGILIISPNIHIFNVKGNYYLSVVFLILYVLLFNEQNVYYAFVNRKKMYKILFWNPILSAIANSGFSIALGAAGLGTTGYIIGTLLSYIVCIIHMRRKVNPYEGHAGLKDLKDTLIRYKAYPLVQMPANMVSIVSAQLPIQFLGRIFGSAALGGYTMACKILSVPVTLLATPVNRVYYREAADRYSRGEDIGSLCFDMVEKNIKLAVIPIGILVVAGKQIVEFVLGPAWAVSGVYITALGFLYLLKYCSACISGTFVIVEKQKLALICSIYSLLQYILCFVIARVLSLTVVQTVIFYAFCDGICNFVNIFLCIKTTQFSMKRFAVFVAKYIVGSSVVIYGIYFLVSQL